MTDVDFLIIGAGTAGCVLAGRLSEEAGCRVVLVEAGGLADDPNVARPLAWPLLQGGTFDWDYRTVPQPHTAGRRHAWPRGRLLGGTSAINAMAHVRGHPDDFDRWGLAGWGFADLLPYFKRSEDWSGPDSPWHGKGGPVRLMQPDEPHPVTLAFLAAAEACGLAPTAEHNGPRMTGPTLNTLTIDGKRRQSAADAYLTPEVLARPNLELLLRAQVRTLTIEGGRCSGVQLLHGGRIAAQRVILAAGAIATPQLLMLSGIGPAAHLQAVGVTPRLDLPEVGCNLQDHLLAAGNVYRAMRPLPRSHVQGSETLLYIDAGLPGPAPDLALACALAPVTTEILPPVADPAFTVMYGFTRPRSRGRLALASADPGADPLIDPNYLSEERDREAYLLALDWAQRLGGAPELDGWRAEEALPGPHCRSPAERLAFLGRAAYTHHHPVGTCRMGADAEAVVRAADLALQGIEGLYVVDGSILPEITTGPCNAAILAIAERASDLLLGRPTLAPEGPPEEPAAELPGELPGDLPETPAA